MAAPAIVRAESLMKIITPKPEIFIGRGMTHPQCWIPQEDLILHLTNSPLAGMSLGEIFYPTLIMHSDKSLMNALDASLQKVRSQQVPGKRVGPYG